MSDLLYRGINSEMFQASNGELKPKGTVSVAELYPGQHLFPSQKLFPGEHQKNAVDKHQNPNRYNEGNLKNNSAYLSTTPIFDRAWLYATRGHKTRGYVFVIDRCLLKQYRVSEFSVSEIATMIPIPEDREVLLLTEPPGSALPREVIKEILSVEPNPPAYIEKP
jgi:hypothetical protein